MNSLNFKDLMLDPDIVRDFRTLKLPLALRKGQLEGGGEVIVITDFDDCTKVYGVLDPELYITLIGGIIK